nr:MAG TPA: tail fiber protein [Caudoviricetes sp.]
MKYTRVRRAVSAVVIDSWDEDRNPEHIKVNGNVTFRPLLNDGDVVQWAGPNGPESLVLAPIQCRISDGIIMHRGGEGVYLAAGGEGCEPDLIQWKAEFSSMQAGGWAFKLKPVMFDAVPDGEVDLTMVAPVAGASEPIVRGPAGTGIDNIKVDGAELVITARSEAGVFEMARIPLEDVVKAEAATAAKSAADSVRTEFTTAASNAAASAKSAATSAQTATTKAGEATTQAANAKTSASAAKTSETNAANSASAAATNAAKAEGSATTASTSAQTATSKAGESTTQAANAANSAGAAKTSETNALSSANAAKSSAAAAATSETNAASSASAAMKSDISADGAARRASDSATSANRSSMYANTAKSDAEKSAASAKQDADRAATIADSTSWDGDKLTVNGKTSPSLRGPKGDPGQDGKMTFEDLTPAQRDSLKGDKGEPGPPGKTGPSGASTWEDIQNKPATFPPESHKHTMSDISDLPGISANIDGKTLVQRYSNGAVLVPDPPPTSTSATSKSYVDSVGNTKADKIHKHTMSDISDMPKVEYGVIGGTIVRRFYNGAVTVPSTPPTNDSAAPKSYVDTALGTAKAYTDALIVVGDTDAKDGKLHIVYE